jgi:mono/diheme cytochrome c family protein
VKCKFFWVGAGLLSLGLIVFAQHESPQGQGGITTQIAERAVQDGVYTARQAERGKEIYRSVCGGCHGVNLTGGTAPALAGAAFQGKWKERTLGDFFDYIKTRMPPGRSNLLTAQQTSDVIAYILQTNQYKAGTVLLPPDYRALQTIAFDKTAQEAVVKAAQTQQTQPQPSSSQPQSVAPSDSSGARTVLNGVFTAAQTDRGRAAYLDSNNSCAGCHGSELGGSPGGPGLVRASFRSRWGGKNVGELFEYTKTRMPPGRAGSLSDQTYIDIIAFILRANNYPPGQTELRANLDELRQIGIPR